MRFREYTGTVSGMSEINRPTCPQCGNIEMDLGTHSLVAVCGACGWKGAREECPVLVTSEKLWDTERAWQLVLNVMLKTSAGVYVQLFEFLGYLPKRLEKPEGEMTAELLERHNALADELRGEFLRQVFEGLATSAIEAAMNTWARWREEMGDDVHVPAPKGVEDIDVN